MVSSSPAPVARAAARPVARVVDAAGEGAGLRVGGWFSRLVTQRDRGPALVLVEVVLLGRAAVPYEHAGGDGRAAGRGPVRRRDDQHR